MGPVFEYDGSEGGVFVSSVAHSIGDLAQMVERSLSMREALGSMPSFSIFADIQMKLVTVLGQSVLQDIKGLKLL